MATTFTVRTEDDAWHVLEQWVNGKPIDVVNFGKWPRLDITIRGGDFNSSLNSGQMAAFVQLRLAVERGFAAIAHGAYDARRLKRTEEESLEFRTSIKKGSSITETDLSPLVKAFAQIVSDNPQLTIAAALVVGLMFVARPLVLKHLENRAKQLENDDRAKLLDKLPSYTSTAQHRSTLMDRAVDKIALSHPQFPQLLPDASASQWQMASSAASATGMTFAGVELNQEQLDALSQRRAFRQSETTYITDTFSVSGVVKFGKVYRIQLRSPNLQLSAEYRAPQLSQRRITQLMQCIMKSQSILADIQIKTVDKSQVLGRLIHFEIVPTPDD